MKAQLTFDLGNPLDKHAFDEIACGDAKKLKSAMYEFSEQVLRKYYKYGIPFEKIEGLGGTTLESPEGNAAFIMLEHLRSEFHRLLTDHDARLD